MQVERRRNLINAAKKKKKGGGEKLKLCCFARVQKFPKKCRQEWLVLVRGGTRWDLLGQNLHLLTDPRGPSPKPPGRAQALIKLTRDCLVNICLPPWPPGATEENSALSTGTLRGTGVWAKPKLLRRKKKKYCEPQSRRPGGASVRSNAACGLQRRSALHGLKAAAS